MKNLDIRESDFPSSSNVATAMLAALMSTSGCYTLSEAQMRQTQQIAEDAANRAEMNALSADARDRTERNLVRSRSALNDKVSAVTRAGYEHELARAERAVELEVRIGRLDQLGNGPLLQALRLTYAREVAEIAGKPDPVVAHELEEIKARIAEVDAGPWIDVQVDEDCGIAVVDHSNHEQGYLRAHVHTPHGKDKSCTITAYVDGQRPHGGTDPRRGTDTSDHPRYVFTNKSGKRKNAPGCVRVTTNQGISPCPTMVKKADRGK